MGNTVWHSMALIEPFKFLIPPSLFLWRLHLALATQLLVSVSCFHNSFWPPGPAVFDFCSGKFLSDKLVCRCISGPRREEIHLDFSERPLISFKSKLKLCFSLVKLHVTGRQVQEEVLRASHFWCLFCFPEIQFHVLKTWTVKSNLPGKITPWKEKNQEKADSFLCNEVLPSFPDYVWFQLLKATINCCVYFPSSHF